MTDMVRIYTAGTFESRDRIAEIKRRLNRVFSCHVTSTWTEEAADVPLADVEKGFTDEDALQIARRDLDEIGEANLLIIDTIDTNDRGGKDFESGLAEAQGKEWWVVGPYRNVFQRLAWQHFESWDQAIAYLEDETESERYQDGAEFTTNA